MKFIKSSEKKKILAELEDQYGITKLPYLLIKNNNDIHAFSGNLSKEEINELNKLINIELIGMRLINKVGNILRLNFDAVSLLRKQITKNIIKINKKQFEHWIRGYDLEIEAKLGIVILKYDDELVGLGKSNGEKIFNYVPKRRKIKTTIK